MKTAGLVMGRPEPVAGWLRRIRNAKQLGDIFGRLVHGVPQLEVARRLWMRRANRRIPRICDRHERTLDAEFIPLGWPWVQRHSAARVLRLHLTNPANRHHHVRVVGVPMFLVRVDVRDLFEELGF
jgi:hypothetical protein